MTPDYPSGITLYKNSWTWVLVAAEVVLLHYLPSHPHEIPVDSELYP